MDNIIFCTSLFSKYTQVAKTLLKEVNIICLFKFQGIPRC